MTRTVKKLFACVLALAMLLSVTVPGLAKNGPYVPEEEGGWAYARLELVELDENGEPLTVINEEYGYPEQKALPLYANSKAVAQEGAVYDPASNTLTITDLQGNFKLRAVLMGDDFTLCVKGDCRLAGVEAHGGGVMYPKWGCGLRFTGDGSLTLNADQKLESGILIAPQEEAAFFLTVEPEVTLTVGGSKTAIEAWGFTGAFTLTVDGEEASIKAQPAVRTVNMQLRGYSNPSKTNLRMCDNSSDPEGIYQISEWFRGDEFVNVTVQRYIYILSIDAYVEDYDWKQSHATDEHGNEVSYETLADAAAAGFTPRKNGEGEDVWLDDVTVYGNNNDQDVYEDAEGNRYVVGFGTNDAGEYGTYAYTAQEYAELPGEYVFMYAAGVDPETLTPVMEDRVFEGQYDWYYPEKEYTHSAASAIEVMLGDVDKDTKITAGDARLALRRAVDLEDYAEGSYEFIACDVDKDGKVTANDARSILRAAVELEDPATW